VVKIKIFKPAVHEMISLKPYEQLQPILKTKVILEMTSDSATFAYCAIFFSHNRSKYLGRTGIKKKLSSFDIKME